MGFNPPFAEGAEFTEWKTNAFTNQATTAGQDMRFILYQNVNVNAEERICVVKKMSDILNNIELISKLHYFDTLNWD